MGSIISLVGKNLTVRGVKLQNESDLWIFIFGVIGAVKNLVPPHVVLSAKLFLNMCFDIAIDGSVKVEMYSLKLRVLDTFSSLGRFESSKIWVSLIS